MQLSSAAWCCTFVQTASLFLTQNMRLDLARTVPYSQIMIVINVLGTCTGVSFTMPEKSSRMINIHSKLWYDFPDAGMTYR